MEEFLIEHIKKDELNSVTNQKVIIESYIKKNEDLKCLHCGSNLIIKNSKNQIYRYCSSYIKDKSCLKYSINKKKLEQMVKDEIIKKINIE